MQLWIYSTFDGQILEFRFHTSYKSRFQNKSRIQNSPRATRSAAPLLLWNRSMLLGSVLWCAVLCIAVGSNGAPHQPPAPQLNPQLSPPGQSHVGPNYLEKLSGQWRARSQSAGSTATPTPPTYYETYHLQPLDHFSYATDQKLWEQRSLVSGKRWLRRVIHDIHKVRTYKADWESKCISQLWVQKKTSGSPSFFCFFMCVNAFPPHSV